jgi:Ca-activated chloride channel family protein
MWDFALPLAFLLLPLPLLARRLLPARARASGALRVPDAIAARLAHEGAPGLAAAGAVGRQLLPWVIWVALVVALAGPRVVLPARALPASGRDIILAFDLSGSMLREDFVLDGKTVQRLEAVRRIGGDFIRSRVGDRVGLVVFAEQAYVAAAPTFDVEAVARALGEIEIGLVGRSTGIGDGLGLALKRLRDLQAKGGVIILMSDGSNNAGRSVPIEVAQLAGKLGIRVHTIALGVRDTSDPGDDPDPVDAATLQSIAQASGGTAFRVRTSEDLVAVGQSINALEKREGMAPPAEVRRELWVYPASLAFLAALALMLSNRGRAT